MPVILLTNQRPTLLLNANPKRTRIMIQMQSSSVDANNSGRIHIAFGFQPVATVNHPSQGEILLQTAAIDEAETKGKKLGLRYKRAIWATSSQDNQSLVVIEEVAHEEEPKE